MTVIKTHDRVFVHGPGPSYATVIGIDWSRDKAINIRLDNGAEDWVYQTRVTVIRPPDLGPVEREPDLVGTWDTIPTVRLRWFEAVGDWLDRFIAHGSTTYPSPTAQRKAWWDLYDEGKALLEKRP